MPRENKKNKKNWKYVARCSTRPTMGNLEFSRAETGGASRQDDLSISLFLLHTYTRIHSQSLSFSFNYFLLAGSLSVRSGLI